MPISNIKIRQYCSNAIYVRAVLTHNILQWHAIRRTIVVIVLWLSNRNRVPETTCLSYYPEPSKWHFGYGYRIRNNLNNDPIVLYT